MINKTDYSSLMQNRIEKVLMICSNYDAYTLEEDGRIESQIFDEYVGLNLSNPPCFKWVNSFEQADKVLNNDSNIDLIISMYKIGDRDIFKFARSVKDRKAEIPFVLLANYTKELHSRLDKEDISGIDYVFSWQGNADLILAIIKLIEDDMNAENDIINHGVQTILLVEDSIRYYSTYLPALYKIILQQSAEFLKETANEHQQQMHKRARPKILLATNLEDALSLYDKYKNNILGVISDVGFVKKKNDPIETEQLNAGIELSKYIKADNPYMPIILQSSQKDYNEESDRLGLCFLYKYSKALLIELNDFICEEFAFGDFVLKDLETKEITHRAKNLKELQTLVAEGSKESLLYVTSKNKLSKWMFSRGLFDLAKKIKDIRNDSFESHNELKDFIIQEIKNYRMYIGQGVVSKFEIDNYNRYTWFARMGEGSIGGKARGLAFMNTVLQKYQLLNKYEGVSVLIPRTVVIGTDFFDLFIKENGLQYVINSEITDEELLSEFVASRLPHRLIEKLKVLISHSSKPLAIRSSSKLEDSHYQPFAGIYSTYMIPQTENRDQMLRLVSKAIKSVYASVFFAASRAYIHTTSNLISEEKMGVVIQDICGTEFNNYFFPTLSGVARSRNFYPIGAEKCEDGVVDLAYGLGKLIVEGGRTLRFSPKHTRNILQLSTPKLAMQECQNIMYALDLKPEEFKTSIDDGINIKAFEIKDAKNFSNFRMVASMWDMDNDRITSYTEHKRGMPIITFDNILQYNKFPLAKIIEDILKISEEELKYPVEIEFAVNADVGEDKNVIFNLLQVRPIAEQDESSKIDWEEIDIDNSIIYAEKALGSGQIKGVTELVYIKNDVFDKSKTHKMAEEINSINAKMREEGKGYILIGPGRWGSSDPWLGVPTKWNDISEAKVIVECGLKDFQIDASQGSHFFQNITSLGVGYLTINPFRNDGKFNEEKLKNMKATYESEFIRVISFEEEPYIYIDGHSRKGVII